MSGAASLKDIYNILLAGKRLQLPFNGKEESEYFRVRMAQYKRAQDTVMLNLDVMQEDERQKYIHRWNEEDKIATLKFEDKPNPKQYSFLILCDDMLEQK